MHQIAYAGYKAEVQVDPCCEEDKFGEYASDVKEGFKQLSIGDANLLDYWLMCNGYTETLTLTSGTAEQMWGMADVCWSNEGEKIASYNAWHIQIHFIPIDDMFGHRIVVSEKARPKKPWKNRFRLHVWHYVDKRKIAY